MGVPAICVSDELVKAALNVPSFKEQNYILCDILIKAALEISV